MHGRWLPNGPAAASYCCIVRFRMLPRTLTPAVACWTLLDPAGPPAGASRTLLDRPLWLAGPCWTARCGLLDRAGPCWTIPAGLLDLGRRPAGPRRPARPDWPACWTRLAGLLDPVGPPAVRLLWHCGFGRTLWHCGFACCLGFAIRLPLPRIVQCRAWLPRCFSGEDPSTRVPGHQT